LLAWPRPGLVAGGKTLPANLRPQRIPTPRLD